MAQVLSSAKKTGNMINRHLHVIVRKTDSTHTVQLATAQDDVKCPLGFGLAASFCRPIEVDLYFAEWIIDFIIPSPSTPCPHC